MQNEPPARDRSDDDREGAGSQHDAGSEEQGYEGAGVEEGGGYQRSAQGGGYERSGTEDEDYDPRREAEGDT